jgi:hypothetical protein
MMKLLIRATLLAHALVEPSQSVVIPSQATRKASAMVPMDAVELLAVDYLGYR